MLYLCCVDFVTFFLSSQLHFSFLLGISAFVSTLLLAFSKFLHSFFMEMLMLTAFMIFIHDFYGALLYIFYELYWMKRAHLKNIICNTNKGLCCKWETKTNRKKCQQTVNFEGFGGNFDGFSFLNSIFVNSDSNLDLAIYSTIPSKPF